MNLMKKSHRGQDKETKVMLIDLNLVSNCYRCLVSSKRPVYVFFSFSLSRFLRFGLFGGLMGFSLICINFNNMCSSHATISKPKRRNKCFFSSFVCILLLFSHLCRVGFYFFGGCFAIWTDVSIWHHTILHENLYARIRFELREASLQFFKIDTTNEIPLKPLSNRTTQRHYTCWSEIDTIDIESIDCATMNQTQFEML